MQRPVISRSGDHLVIDSSRGRRRYLLWLVLSSALGIGFVVLGVAGGTPALVVVGALFALLAIGALGALPAALKPTTLKDGVLSVPRLGLGHHMTRTIDLSQFECAGVTARWLKQRYGRSLSWELVLWHDAHQPVLVPGDFTAPRGRWAPQAPGADTFNALLAALHEGDEVLLQSELGKVAALLDGEVQARRSTPVEPTGGRIRSYLPPGRAVVWIPSLGAAFDDGSSRDAATPSG